MQAQWNDDDYNMKVQIKEQFWQFVLPSFIHEFIEKVVDLVGDIHCGFRAVEVLHNMTVDDHHMICYQLLKELNNEEC